VHNPPFKNNISYPSVVTFVGGVAPPPRRLRPNNPKDSAFLKEAMAAAAEWVAAVSGSAPDAALFHDLPECNGFLRKCLYEGIEVLIYIYNYMYTYLFLYLNLYGSLRLGAGRCPVPRSPRM